MATSITVTTKASNQITMTTTLDVTSTSATITSSTIVTMPTVTMAARPHVTSTSATITSSTMVTTPTITMAANASTITAVIVPVVVVVLVLVVCLLVVCAIATIIILYQRAKHKSPRKQETTELHDLAIAPPPYYADIPAPQDNDGLYSHTHHGQHNTTTQQLPNPIYSTLAEGGAPADYSVITEARDTSDGGMVYSTVVRKDGKKTTVKTMTTTQNEDNEQTSSTSDTVQPAEGMVYSAVIHQDGKKTSVKVTVE